MQSNLTNERVTGRGLKVLRASHLGMCFGVRDAIALALRRSAEAPLTILGELVHNQTVTDDLKAKGIQIETRAEQVRTQTAMVTAHGASARAIEHARAQGLEVFEGTCPLVKQAHRAVASLVAAGFHPVVIGQRGHVEVRGLTEDLAEYDIVLSEADIALMNERPKFGIAAQTTQPVARVRELAQAIREKFPNSEVRFIDTVCQPTKLRQAAAVELAEKCDAVIVIGGTHSNNTRELVETCRRFCAHVYHVQCASDVQGEWLEGVDTIGLTAGTSTPDSVIDEVDQRLRATVRGA